MAWLVALHARSLAANKLSSEQCQGWEAQMSSSLGWLCCLQAAARAGTPWGKHCTFVQVLDPPTGPSFR